MICSSRQCVQSTLNVQEYLVLKVHAGLYVHKPSVLSRYLYCGEPHPSRLPKNTEYVVRFTVKTPILYLQYRSFRWQAWKMQKTGYKWQLVFFELLSGEISWFAEVLCELTERKQSFAILYMSCQVTHTFLFCYVFI